MPEDAAPEATPDAPPPAAAADEAGTAAAADQPGPDRLVVDLAERLWRHGLVVELDHGLPGGLHLPLAVGHPDLPGELLVAVLTDDDAYLGEPSVRVRDRQVAERLERLGWSVLRVWSAAAFLDPEAEVDRIRRALHAVADRRLAEAVAERRRGLLAVPAVPLLDDDGTGPAPTLTGFAVPTAGLPAGGGTGPDEVRSPSADRPGATPGEVRDAASDGTAPDEVRSPSAAAGTAPDEVRAPGAVPAAPESGPGSGTGPSGSASASASDSTSASASGSTRRTSAWSPPEPPRPATSPIPSVAADIPGIMEAAAPMTGAVRAVQPTLAVPGGPRPDVRPGLPISAYSDDQLDDLVAWLVSDGSERTPDELAAAVRRELGVTRRGTRIDAVVSAAVSRAPR